ncbi:MAG: hypothetical protein CM15mV24_0760 [Bellamyvirus sp.]|nr:MAG: hypothetical protein CM15mV24_0760 [Bellamyvirus sp.]
MQQDGNFPSFGHKRVQQWGKPPPTTTNTVSVTPLGGIEGQVTSSETGLDFSQIPNFTITDPGKAFPVPGPRIREKGKDKPNCDPKNNRGTSVTKTQVSLPSNRGF